MENPTQTNTDPKVIGIISYLTFIGWIVGVVMNNPKDDYASFHIRQSLGLMLMFAVAWVPVIGWLVGIAAIIGWIIGFIGALQGEKNAIPYLGPYFQEWFEAL